MGLIFRVRANLKLISIQSESDWIEIQLDIDIGNAWLLDPAPRLGHNPTYNASTPCAGVRLHATLISLNL